MEKNIYKNQPLREMAKIVDNTIPQHREPVEMCRIVEKPAPKTTGLVEMVKIIEKPDNTTNEKEKQASIIPTIVPLMDGTKEIAFLGEENEFRFYGGILFYKDVPFLNCEIKVLEIITSENKDYYKCQIDVKGETFTKTVPVADFSVGKWVFDTIGVATLCDRTAANNILYRYLSLLIASLDISKRTTAFEKPGWYEKDGRYMYITPQGVVGDKESTSYSKYGQTFKSLNPDQRCFNSYLDMVNITRSPVGAILVLYTSMSLMNTFFRKASFTPKFLLFVAGRRGSFKTSISLAMSQIESRDTPLYTLKATKAGIESAFKVYRDAIIVVDDLAPTQELQDRRNIQSNMETVVRAFGDGTGHKRMTVQYESEGGAIITGEYTTGCESSMARTLILKLNKEDVDTERLSAIQNNKEFVLNYALSLITNLSFVINQYNYDILGFIEYRGKEIRKQFVGKFSNERYGEYIAQLTVTAEIILNVGKMCNLLSDQQADMYYKIFTDAIYTTVKDNDIRLKEQSPINVLATAFNLYILDEKCLVCKLGTVTADLDNVIFYDDEYYYCSQKFCCKAVNEYIKENSISCADFTSTSIADTLEHNGIIKSHMEGKVKRKSEKLKGYGSKRFMKINKKELSKFINFN